jgi:hypothetical protein
LPYNPIQLNQLNTGQLYNWLSLLFSGSYIPPNSPYDQRGSFALPSGTISGSGNWNIPFTANPSYIYQPSVVGANTLSASISGFNATGFIYFLGGVTPDSTYTLYWRATL